MKKKTLEKTIWEINMMVEYLCERASEEDDSAAEVHLRTLRNILDEMTGFDDLHNEDGE